MTIDDILQQEDEVEVIITLSGPMLRKVERVGWHGLTLGEQVFWSVYWLDMDVNNGGFHQYFFNSGGDYAQDVIPALHAIGAAPIAALVDEAMRVFPSGRASRDRGRRWDELESLGEEAEKKLDRLDDIFFEANVLIPLVAYMRQNRDQFPGNYS